MQPHLQEISLLQFQTHLTHSSQKGVLSLQILSRDLIAICITNNHLSEHQPSLHLQEQVWYPLAGLEALEASVLILEVFQASPVSKASVDQTRVPLICTSTFQDFSGWSEADAVTLFSTS